MRDQGHITWDHARRAFVVLAAILSPVVTGVAIYYKGQNDLDARFSQISIRFVEKDLVLEKDFVRKPDLAEIDRKIDSIGKDVLEIKSRLSRRVVKVHYASTLARP